MIPLAHAAAADKAAQSPEIQERRLRKAAQDLEGLFLSKLMKTMRTTVPGGKSEKVPEKSILGDFADLELGRVLARRKGIGLADMIYRSLAAGESEQSATTPAQRPTSIPLQKRPRPLEELQGRSYDLHVQRAARRHRVDPRLVHAVVAVESAGNPTALSSANAKGLMQLTDSTAEMLGVTNVWDPQENIEGGTRYLRQLLDRFQGDLQSALAAYNAGPGAVDRHRGLPPYSETKNFVRRVLDHYWNRTGIDHAQ